MWSSAVAPLGAASTAYPAPSRPRHRKSPIRFSSSTTRIRICLQLIKLRLESQGNSILLAAEAKFQVLHLLLFHGEEEQAPDRLVGLFLRQNLGVEHLFQRVFVFA